MSAFDDAAEILVKGGISPTDAKRAVDQCVMALKRASIKGLEVGLSATTIVMILTNPPSAAVVFGTAGAISIGNAAYQLGAGSGCMELRQAVMNWNTGFFNQNSFELSFE